MASLKGQKAWKHLYKTALWKKLRLNQLSIMPICTYCDQQGRVELARVVDHIKPHKGDEILFYNPKNLQSMCFAHHNSTKAREENSDTVLGCDTDGIPLDPNHHWN